MEVTGFLSRFVDSGWLQETSVERGQRNTLQGPSRGVERHCEDGTLAMLLDGEKWGNKNLLHNLRIA